MDFFCNNCERFSLNWCAVKALQWDQCYPSTRVQVSDKMPQNACKSSSGRDLQDVNQKEFISNVQRLEAEAWRRPTWSLSPSVCLSVPVFRRSRVFSCLRKVPEVASFISWCVFHKIITVWKRKREMVVVVGLSFLYKSYF